MPKANRLIHTKLRPPFVRTELVRRPRLQARICEGLRRPLTLIIAPAGYGKTTLLVSSIGEGEMPVAWLSLDKDDSQPARFLTYLVAALQAVDPALGGEAAQLLAVGRPAPSEAVLTSLINDLALAGGELALVLDDYQFISSPAVHEGVTFLLDHCPTTFHLVIATRSDPPLPVTRLRARGQLVELRAADLGFTEPEAALFLNDVMGLGLDAPSVAALEARTEGWIAGLQMAALSMRDRDDVPGFIQGFSGTNRYILDYLMEEVLANQPPELQRFLLYTSILDRLSAPLCDFLAATDRWLEPDHEESFPRGSFAPPDSGRLLEQLERVNLFLVALDDERVWYRYHHLFADLLRARLLQARPDLVPLLHSHAAVWLEDHGLVPAAIGHLLAAGEVGRAADLVERYGPAHLAENDPSVLQLAGKLPQELILARPRIGLYQAWLLITQGHIGQALPLLKGLAGHLAGTDSGSRPDWMGAVVDSALAFLAPSEALDAVPLPEPGLLDEIPAVDPILRNAADFLYGMALGRRGELDHAVAFSLRSVEREKMTHGARHLPTLAPFLSRIYLMQGRLHAAAALDRASLDPIQAQGPGFLYVAGSIKIDLGEVLTEWNCLDEAEELIRDGLRDNEPWRNIMTDGFGLVALTRVLVAQGKIAEALETVGRLERRLREDARPREFDEPFHTLHVRVQLAGGDLEGASRWADQTLLSEEARHHEDLYRLTLARIRLAQGRFTEVEELLAGNAPPPGPGSYIARQLESDLILAAALAGQEHLPQAFRLVEESLALGEPEGYVRIFLDLGEPARALLMAYLRSQGPAHESYARKILDAFSPPGADGPQPIELVESLTERELEVLRLVAEGMTNREIARQLVLATGTVKAHTANIYGKLDVRNRTEAVGRARQLGILA